MKLLVIIHRQRPHEEKPGTLRAWIEQGGQRGENLLAKRHTDVDTAVQTCDKIIMDAYKLIDPPEIEYRVDEFDAVGEAAGSMGSDKLSGK